LLRARGEHQRHLCHRIEPCGARVQQNGADALADLGSAGLARGEHVDAFGAQDRSQLLQLGGFAAAVEALEGDELPAPLLIAHAAIISTATRVWLPSLYVITSKFGIILLAASQGELFA
jgi:hypothetical protein